MLSCKKPQVPRKERGGLRYSSHCRSSRRVYSPEA